MLLGPLPFVKGKIRDAPEKNKAVKNMRIYYVVSK